ncbi:MAG: precorrin-3B synthase [Acidobacteriaceae bacterium]
MKVGENLCPGIIHAVPAKDGFLIRIRIPGGMIDMSQLRIIADISSAFADGAIELTSRANIQLRAIKRQNLEQVVEEIALAGLLPSPLHDRVRNIVTSPIAGLDAEELIDPRPLIRQLDQRLRAEAIFADLHPKFSFAVHGGPRRFSQHADDLSLEAVDFNASTYFRLSIGGVALRFVATRGDAIGCMLEAARMCIRLAKESGLPVRAGRVVEIPGAMERIIDSLSPVLTPFPYSPHSPSAVEALLGVHPAMQADRVNIAPSVPLGQITSEQAHCVAEAAREWECDLRLAGWRGLVLGSIPRSAADSVVDRLHSIGLSCEGRDGFRGIAACAGSVGCEASLADVRGDAASLAQRLAGQAVPPGWTVNLSGCDKQCARRHGATAELTASPSGYILKIKGQIVASSCSPKFAVDAVAALHADLISEAAS